VRPPHASQVVRCLLINPFPESALNEEAGKLFMEDYDSYFRKAQMMTEVHALAKKGEASGAAAGEGGEGSASEPVEKRQKQPADADKAAEKRRQDKKKSLKRCAAAQSGMPCHAAAAPPPHVAPPRRAALSLTPRSKRPAQRPFRSASAARTPRAQAVSTVCFFRALFDVNLLRR
jgi:hypothetical protein